MCEWSDPPFAAGHWVPEMVEAAGGHDVLGRRGPSVLHDDRGTPSLERDPELVVLACCGFDAERAAREANLPDLPHACRRGRRERVLLAPEPADRAGVEQLAHLMHPEAAPDPGLPCGRARRYAGTPTGSGRGGGSTSGVSPLSRA